MSEHANWLAQESIIVDAHIDLPSQLARSRVDISVAQTAGDFDITRALAGGLNVAFMSIFIPTDLDLDDARNRADNLIDMVDRIVCTWPDQFANAYQPNDVREQFKSGRISLPMGMENGTPIGTDLSQLDYYYKRGIRYITLAHSESNQIADSSYDKIGRWSGLSPFGELVVRKMNRLGIMVDVSHLSDAAVEDVLAVSGAPIIATHTSARVFTPGWVRNLPDVLIRRIAESGGIIMINFGSAFVDPEANRYAQNRDAKFKEAVLKNGLDNSADAEQEFKAKYDLENGPYPFAHLDDVLNTIEHVVEIAGIDHVGLGSDFDGLGDSLPEDLKDVSQYPNLIEGLISRGFGDSEIRQILGESFLRFWESISAPATTEKTYIQEPTECNGLPLGD